MPRESDRCQPATFDALPDDADALRTIIAPRYGNLFDPLSYGLA